MAERRTYEIGLEPWQVELLHQVALSRGSTPEAVLKEIADMGLQALTQQGFWKRMEKAEEGGNGT